MGLFWKFRLKGFKLLSLLALPAVRERIPGWVSPSLCVGICCHEETPAHVHSRPQHILGRAVCKNKTRGGGGIFKTLPGGPRDEWLVYAPPLEFQRFKERDGVCSLIVSLAPEARPGVYHPALWTLGGSA